MFRKTIIFLLGLFISSIFIFSSAQAGDVILSWTASTGDVTGYKVYYGRDPGNYTSNIDVGNVTQYTISGLEEGPTYYFVARAYNDAGESENSNEVSWSWSPVDNESPTIMITSPTTNSTYETYESTVSLSGSASDNVGVAQVLWSNLTAGSGGNATGTESWSVSSIALSEGNNSITVTANDESNNQGSKTVNVTYLTSIPDTTPPTGSISINDGASSTKTLDVILTLSAGDAESGMGDGAEMKISNDGENWTAAMPYSESMSYILPGGEGTKTVFANFSDAAGNWMLSPVSDQINYMPNQEPVASASASTLAGEAPLSVSFTGTGTDSDGTIASYAWDFGDGSTSNTQNPSHTYNTAGTYTATLTVTDDDGATGNDTVTMTVYASYISNQLPVASVSASPLTGEAPLAVSFTGTGTDSDGTIASYAWDFGDGSTSNTQNPSHTYNAAGTYTATFTVTDDDGESAATSVTITVSAKTTVAVEDIIVDNGDPQTSYTGRWRESRDSNYYGTRSQYAQYGNATYTWNAAFPTTGTYDVYMRWSYLYWNNTDVPVQITHSGGVSNVTVNQKLSIGEWVLLGRYNFGTSGSIKVIHSSGYRTTSIDAVKFVSAD